jgi:DNA-binding transcriptional regulator YhcF (GntR family)
MHKLTYEDVEQAHIDRLKALGYTDEEILGIIEKKNELDF